MRGGMTHPEPRLPGGTSGPGLPGAASEPGTTAPELDHARVASEPGLSGAAPPLGHDRCRPGPNPERIVLGRFTIEHRRIEVYQVAGGSTTFVRLRRIGPAPAVDLGCINRIGSPFARLHLYRAEWPTTVRRTARDKATAIWHHAARHEAEVEG